MLFVFLSALWWLHWTCVHAEQSLVWLYRALSLARLGRCGFPLPQTIDCLVQGLPKVLIFNGTCSGSAFINLPGFERQDCLLQQVVWRRFETWMRKRNPSHPSHGHGVFCSKATLYFHTHNSGLLVCLDIGYLSSFSHIFCIKLATLRVCVPLLCRSSDLLLAPGTVFPTGQQLSHDSLPQPATACHSSRPSSLRWCRTLWLGLRWRRSQRWKGASESGSGETEWISQSFHTNCHNHAEPVFFPVWYLRHVPTSTRSIGSTSTSRRRLKSCLGGEPRNVLSMADLKRTCIILYLADLNTIETTHWPVPIVLDSALCWDDCWKDLKYLRQRVRFVLCSINGLTQIKSVL